jgi:hypothetical protein
MQRRSASGRVGVRFDSVSHRRMLHPAKRNHASLKSNIISCEFIVFGRCWTKSSISISYIFVSLAILRKPIIEVFVNISLKYIFIYLVHYSVSVHNAVFKLWTFFFANLRSTRQTTTGATIFCSVLSILYKVCTLQYINASFGWLEYQRGYP